MNEVLNNIKFRFKNASIVEKLIYINLAVFLLVHITNTLGFLFKYNNNLLLEWFSLPDAFSEFITKPWTIFTYGFLHTSFIHLLLNLVALFFIGNLFKEYFTAKQVLNFYIFGTLFGGVIFLLSYNFFPVFTEDNRQHLLLGASAGISAIFAGIATYMPNYELKFPLIGFVKLWILAAIWVALDVIQIPAGNAGGRLAHIGGALFGFLYVKQASNKELNIFGSLKNVFKKKEKPLKTVYNSGRKRTEPTSKNENQQQVDAILDKISKSGYDTLTKAEKEFLFNQGRK